MKTVRTLARTMLAYERPVGERSRGCGRAASRAAASSFREALFERSTHGSHDSPRLPHARRLAPIGLAASVTPRISYRGLDPAAPRPVRDNPDAHGSTLPRS